MFLEESEGGKGLRIDAGWDRSMAWDALLEGGQDRVLVCVRGEGVGKGGRERGEGRFRRGKGTHKLLLCGMELIRGEKSGNSAANHPKVEDQ